MIKVRAEKIIKDCDYCPACARSEAPKWANQKGLDYFCTEAGRLLASNLISANDLPPIPDWCPCKIEDVVVKDVFDYEVGQVVFRVDEVDGKLRIKAGEITNRYILRDNYEAFGPFYVLADDRWLYSYFYHEDNLFVTAEQALQYLLSLDATEQEALLTYLVNDHANRK